MISKSTVLHLRFPLSVFLLPVFLLALTVSPLDNWARIVAVFAIIHLLVYPAMYGYNSYYDRDEGSIGGLKHPPVVTKDLLYVALLMDIAAVYFAHKLGLTFALAIGFYIVCSMLYSHPLVRVKKDPVAGWFLSGLIQGGVMFMTAYQAITGCALSDLGITKLLLGAAVSSLYLWALSPMSQIYQQEEDFQRDDRTISMLLTEKGTFFFSVTVFTEVIIMLALYVQTYVSTKAALVFAAAQLPAWLHLIRWCVLFCKEKAPADYRSTMILFILSSAGFNLCMIGIIILRAAGLLR